MKKIISTLALLVFSTTVYASPIYTYEETTPISNSISLTTVKEFHSDHNISYSYLKADLSDANTHLKLLTSSNGTDKLATVSDLAKTDSDTVGAVNGDFFSIYSGSKAFSLGIEIQDGKLIQSPINPSTMATVAETDGSVSMSYLDFHIMAVAPNGAYNEIRHLNKHTSYYGDILMFTKEFNNGYSPAPGGEVLEVVVSDGKITEFRRNMPPVQIPENGCVLTVSEGVNMFFANNFNVGDNIKFDYYITPYLYGASTAFGGGAMLVSDGQLVTEYSHVVSGYNPRTAVGVDKSGKTLYLVTVDGRQAASRGMTMSELGSLMLSLGCYNAVNLDGGGSTNMVASTLWQKDLHTVNSPTENRRVINAVGLSYTGESTNPYGIAVKSDRKTVFIGDSAALSYQIYNEYMRPLDGYVIYASDYGTVENGVFVAEKAGNATISARSGQAYGETSIFVVDKIDGIETKNYLNLSEGRSANLGILVFDNEGHYVAVENTAPFKITSSDPSVASVYGQTVTAHKNGTAIISVEKDGAIAYTSVAVGNEPLEYLNTFEEQCGTFSSYPTYVEGGFDISGAYMTSGSNSGRLLYDFSTEQEEAKAAYLNFTQKPQLHNSCNTITVKAYSETDFNHELWAQFTDGNGELFRVSLGKNLEGGKWHTLTGIIPKDNVRPVTLNRIYALYTPGETKDNSRIYLDDLSFISTKATEFVSAPQNVYNLPQAPQNSSSTFRIGGLLKNTDTLAAKLVNSKMTQAIGSSASSLLLKNTSTFGAKEDSNALYITVNTSKGGIQSTDSKQWDKMVQAINNSGKSNIFIISDNSVFGNSTLENDVILDYFASLNKNVFVITGGEKNTYKNINGVGYFTLATNPDEKFSLQTLDNCSCLEFKFGSQTTFDWVNIY